MSRKTFHEAVADPSEADAKSAKEISKAINVMAPSKAVVGHLMAQDHRTLQQGFAGVVVGFIEAMAANYAEGRVDDRNEASARLCHKIVEEFGDDPAFRFQSFDRFPFI